jgi:cystathionine gamma-lyase
LALERQLAALEGATFGSAFGSGMAAIAGVTGLLSSGDHIVAGRDIYGGTSRLFSSILPRSGISATFVDMSDLNAIREAICPNTRLIWIETPSNPTLRLTDIAAVSALKRPGQIVAVDNTFSSPFFQQPLTLGCDVVVHSTTKYLCGHSDVVGGVVVTNDPDLHKQIAYVQNCVGAIPGPWDSYLTLRGAKTLALCMRAHERNALAVTEYLLARDDVEEVNYPGLRTHPQYDLAKRQMSGSGGIVSFRPKGGASRSYAFATSTRIFNLAVSLGGVESLICHPATMTHGWLDRQARHDIGITDDLLRLSVGIEDIDDLIADLKAALDSTLSASDVQPQSTTHVRRDCGETLFA